MTTATADKTGRKAADKTDDLVGTQHVAETADKAAASIGRPKVLAVFHADCLATKGPGSTVAVVQGGSGKCRLYGKDSLANAFPEVGPECRTLTTPGKMAAYFKVAVVSGKDACSKFMKDKKLEFAGSEKIIADHGKGNKQRGGFRTLNYAAF